MAGRAALEGIPTVPCSLPNCSWTCQEVTTGLRLLRAPPSESREHLHPSLSRGNAARFTLVARDDGRCGPTPLGDGQIVEKLP